MVLIAGGTGTLGTQVVRLLTARGLEVRIITRDPARARHLQGDLVEIVPGDVRDLRAVERAAFGARTVISAIQRLTGTGSYSPKTVDRQGNSNLIQALSLSFNPKGRRLASAVDIGDSQGHDGSSWTPWLNPSTPSATSETRSTGASAAEPTRSSS